MRNTRLWLCLLLAAVLLLSVVCVGCKQAEEPDHSIPPSLSTTTTNGDFETPLIVPDPNDIVKSTTTTTTLGYTTGTGVDASTAHVTVTTDDGEAVTTDGGAPVTSFVSTTTTEATTTSSEATTTTTEEATTTTTEKTEIKLPFVSFPHA